MRIRLTGFIIVVFFSLIAGLIFEALLACLRGLSQEKKEILVKNRWRESDVSVDSVEKFQKRLRKIIKIVILVLIVSYLVISLCMRIYYGSYFYLESLVSWILTILFILVVVALISLVNIFIMFLITKCLWIQVSIQTLVNIWVVVAILGVWLILICVPIIAHVIWYFIRWLFIYKFF